MRLRLVAWLAGLCLTSLACRDVSNFGSSDRDRETSVVRGAAEQAAVISQPNDSLSEPIDEGGTETVMADEPVMVAGGFLSCYSDRAAVADSQASSVSACGIYAPDDPARLLDLPDNLSLLRVSRIDQTGDLINLAILSPQPNAQESYHWAFELQIEAVGQWLEFEFQVDGDDLPGNLVVRAEIQESLPVGLLTLGASYNLRVEDTQQCLSGNPAWSFLNGIAVAQQMFETTCQQTIAYSLSQHETAAGFRIHTENPSPWSCDPQFIQNGYCFRSCISYITAINAAEFTLFGCSANLKQDFDLIELNEGFTAVFAAGDRYLRLEDGVAKVTDDPLLASQFELISR